MIQLINYGEYIAYTTAHLSSRKQFKVEDHPTCKNFDSKKFDDAARAAIKMKHAITGTTIAGMVVIGIILIVTTTLLSFICRSKCSNFYYDMGYFPNFVYFAFFIITMVMKGFIETRQKTMVKLDNYLESMSQAGCFTVGVANALANEYDNLLGTTVSAVDRYSNALISVTGIIWGLLLILIRFGPK